MIQSSDIYLNKTRLAYTWTRLLNTPFWAIYTLLLFIMSKDLHASPWQIACAASLKPTVSFFSLYWSSRVTRRSDRLVSNIVWAGILGHLPFLLVPFIDNAWFFIIASGIYMIFHRGANPAWMEILKINIPEKPRKTVFAWGSAAYHAGGALLAIVVGWLLDDYYQSWRWLFPLTALLSMSAIFFQWNLPIRKILNHETPPSVSLSIKEQFQKPWKEAYELIQQRRDFAYFQIGFILGGSGLMLWSSILPQFFFDVLHLNYKELSVAKVFCTSIGYIVALPLWAKLMNRVDLFTIIGTVTLLAALFPLGLLAAQWYIFWLFAAYFLYGAVQAGSEMSWNLSGPIFSKDEESSTYSSVSMLSVGLRGCIAPPFGSLLYNWTNATVVLLMGGGFCLLATWQMYTYRKKEEKSYVLLSNVNGA
jgi:MFS family permease